MAEIVQSHSTDHPGIADGGRKEQLRFAARVLLDFLGPRLANPGAETKIDELIQPVSLQEPRINENELLEVFASVSLQRELTTKRTDYLGRFDEAAITWDVARPWVDLRAQEIGPPLVDRGSTNPECGSRFSVLITHDIDRTTTLEPLSVLNSLANALRLRAGNWWPLTTALSPRALIRTIERLLDFEVSQQIGALYFMMAGPYRFGRYSPRTDVRWRSARAVARLVQEARMTIGLHGSFSAKDGNSYREEKDRLQQTLACAVTTHRNHYLRFDPTRLYSQLERAGIQFDLSVGFINRIGFRAGCARCHRAFDLQNGRPSNVFSVPQLFMDTILQNRTPEQILLELHGALSHVRAVQGCVCLVFHPETFLIDSRAWPLFQNIVHMCRDLGADLSGRLPDVNCLKCE